MGMPRRVKTKYARQFLDALLRDNTLTQEELIAELEIPRSTFYAILNESKANTRLANLNKIARYMGMRVFFRGEEPVLVPKTVAPDVVLTREQLEAILNTLDPTDDVIDTLRIALQKFEEQTGVREGESKKA